LHQFGTRLELSIRQINTAFSKKAVPKTVFLNYLKKAVLKIVLTCCFFEKAAKKQ
jgi:hypothetical protein